MSITFGFTPETGGHRNRLVFQLRVCPRSAALELYGGDGCTSTIRATVSGGQLLLPGFGLR